jgi:beta-1,2-mannobiose phosphorylase / 1,2-beta-oligomannan phosphorylase
VTLELVETVPLRIAGGPAAAGEYLLSPYVYAGGREIVVRAVPRRDHDPEQKISRAFHGRSSDGVAFALDEAPLLAPGPEDVDRGGIEDPTVVEDSDRLHVFYSGWNPVARRSTLLRADGARSGALVKRGPVLDGAAPPQAKEATLARRDGGWTMFFEVEREASRNASATAPSLAGPWTTGDDVLHPRPDRFDSWHLSPAAFPTAPDGTRVLIYNGADRDARWQIGWCALDPDCAHVLARPDEPIVHASRNTPDQRELAFAASAVERDGLLDVYYSVADTDPARATLRWRA